ncbi:response regulator transcription factor [Panacibacter sp. DH6]|uniref:Response regulator transcription factor n=1 Tax=Panacibacter microcysteis TaxID=2793269 RepID=A0A931E9T1_9BACT|nr:LuxR C-terminal-related transcriptional regulator [Panacibacter microcysteis]MBG9376794.1 response regulator transcription factor [Panacibacter microcysteis]
MDEKQPLTTREREILQLISNGHTDKSIATELSLSDKTVNTYRKQMLKKLHVKNTAMLVRYALENNLVV